ncbi:ABC transporter substrate-binding protein [Actinoplanes sp. GCM10030250]|uniref:ABC transporter substrate-binding protein n=1 Tax=Actinoplanes sp. GCM10030250 TaxID=3273376 RepID=UPI00360CD8FC
MRCTYMRFARRVLAAAAVALLAVSGCGSIGKDPGAAEVEVFTWWADGGEKAGLDALVSRFTADCPGQQFENAAVAGGAGVNAKQRLLTRIQRNDPPDTFQVHAGAELDDYIAAGRLQDLTADYDAWGLRQVLPPGLLEGLTVNGKIYSVPANIHRANVVWVNTRVLAEAGITGTPRTLDALLRDLATLRGAGIEAPLAVGRDWTQLMLLEAVLISHLGAESFTRLFTGATDWNSGEVTEALGDYAALLDYSNADRDSRDWPEAERLLVEGRAAFHVMGDWAAPGLDHFTFPGNDGVFQWLADSFVLPTGAANPDGTRCWLRTVASAEGQREFNVRKGSIPARTDVAGTGFSGYQLAAMRDWKSDIPVPSCAHGSACSQDWQNAVNTALGTFSIARYKDIASLREALAAAAAQYIKG